MELGQGQGIGQAQVMQQPVVQPVVPQFQQPMLQVQPGFVQQPAVQPAAPAFPVQQAPVQQQAPIQQPTPLYGFETYGEDGQIQPPGFQPPVQQQVQPGFQQAPPVQPGVQVQPGIQAPQVQPGVQIQPGVPVQPGVAPGDPNDINAFIEQMFAPPVVEQPVQQPVQQFVQPVQQFAPQPLQNQNMGIQQAPINVAPAPGQAGIVTVDDIVNAMLARTPGTTKDSLVAQLETTLGKSIASLPVNQMQPANLQELRDPRYNQIQAELNQTKSLMTNYLQQQQQAQIQAQEQTNSNYLKSQMQGLSNKYQLSRRDLLGLPDVFSNYLKATQGSVPANISSINFDNIFRQLYPEVGLRQQAPGLQQVQYPNQQGMAMVPQNVNSQPYQGMSDEQLMAAAISQEFGFDPAMFQ